METTKDTIVLRKLFRHMTIEERLSNYSGEIELEVFDWGGQEGREAL